VAGQGTGEGNVGAGNERLTRAAEGSERASRGSLARASAGEGKERRQYVRAGSERRGSGDAGSKRAARAVEAKERQGGATDARGALAAKVGWSTREAKEREHGDGLVRCVEVEFARVSGWDGSIGEADSHIGQCYLCCLT
jgi:hypothetical protein